MTQNTVLSKKTLSLAHGEHFPRFAQVFIDQEKRDSGKALLGRKLSIPLETRTVTPHPRRAGRPVKRPRKHLLRATFYINARKITLIAVLRHPQAHGTANQE